MHSSAEAFARFLAWRFHGTPLRLTAGPNSAFEYLITLIAASEPLIAIGNSTTEDRLRFDLSEATFFVGETSVTAVRTGENPLHFEEA